MGWMSFLPPNHHCQCTGTQSKP